MAVVRSAENDDGPEAIASSPRSNGAGRSAATAHHLLHHLTHHLLLAGILGLPLLAERSDALGEVLDAAERLGGRSLVNREATTDDVLE
jgi:hypothetical protein